MGFNGFFQFNGRTPSDSPGGFTYISKLGTSTVDFIWVNLLGTNLVKEMWVHPVVSGSDHPPIIIELWITSQPLSSNKSTQPKKRFCWQRNRSGDKFHLYPSPLVAVNIKLHCTDFLYQKLCFAISEAAVATQMLRTPGMHNTHHHHRTCSSG